VLLERLFGDINERQEEYLQDIHSSGQHLLELLNEILDLSKVEAGRMDLELSEFELESLLHSTAAMLRERAAAHAIDHRVSVPDDVGTVTSDERRLKQVVLNLMTNAVKFTGEGGSVLVHAGRRGDDVEITVQDTGAGIPEADRERIFESFQQGGRGSSREEGTGLGLTLSRRLVELMGGRLWLRSEVGVGSTFGVLLPQHDARVAARADGPDDGGTAVDVVVIEDDRPSLDLLAAYLSGLAVRVTTARDGHAGLDAVRRLRPAAVLLDIKLPGIDGWHVLRAIRADPELRETPVVVISVLDERARGRTMGASAYLVKPVGRDELWSALGAVGVALPDATAQGVSTA
jgi:CheY-like chemotaxis protein